MPCIDLLKPFVRCVDEVCPRSKARLEIQPIQLNRLCECVPTLRCCLTVISGQRFWEEQPQLWGNAASEAAHVFHLSGNRGGSLCNHRSLLCAVTWLLFCDGVGVRDEMRLPVQTWAGARVRKIQEGNCISKWAGDGNASSVFAGLQWMFPNSTGTNYCVCFQVVLLKNKQKPTGDPPTQKRENWT